MYECVWLCVVLVAVWLTVDGGVCVCDLCRRHPGLGYEMGGRHRLQADP